MKIEIEVSDNEPREYILTAAGRALLADWSVGERVELFGRKNNQQKKNFCDRCGQKIDWEGVEE